MAAMLVNGRSYPRAGGKKCPCCQYWGAKHSKTRPYRKSIKRKEQRQWVKEWLADA